MVTRGFIARTRPGVPYKDVAFTKTPEGEYTCLCNESQFLLGLDEPFQVDMQIKDENLLDDSILEPIMRSTWEIAKFDALCVSSTFTRDETGKWLLLRGHRSLTEGGLIYGNMSAVGLEDIYPWAKMLDRRQKTFDLSIAGLDVKLSRDKLNMLAEYARGKSRASMAESRGIQDKTMEKRLARLKDSLRGPCTDRNDKLNDLIDRYMLRPFLVAHPDWLSDVDVHTNQLSRTPSDIMRKQFRNPYR